MVDLLSSATKFTQGGSLSRHQIGDTELGMAHFAHTSGTSDKCRQCEFWRKRRDSERKRYCMEYIRLTGDDKKAITGNAYACKYFKYGPEKRS